MEKLEDAKEICVDTDILIDFLKKKEPGSRAYERCRNKTSVGITAISSFELLIGARQPNVREKRLEEARSLIEQQAFILPFDEASASKASEIGAELMRVGKGIEIRDLFIASICLARGIPLLTRNKEHFQRITNLRLIDSHVPSSSPS